jgi:protein O-mannosyl-transferase
MAKKTVPITQKQPKTSAEAPAPPRNAEAGSNWILLAVLAFAAFLYWPSLQNGFTNWDDDVYVTANEHLSFNAQNLKVLATKQVAGNFHPLTMWSLSWDRGNAPAPDPKPFHRSNLFLHLLNTALVFWLVRRLRFGAMVAGLSAMFFAIHPMHVESVAWVSGRKDLLFAAFFLAGLIAFTYNEHRKNLGLWLLTFVFFLLSCLSKPAAIVFPLALWLVHWYLAPESAQKGKHVLYLIPFLALSAVFSYITLVYQQDIGAVDEQYGLFKRSLFAGAAFISYLWKFGIPMDLSAFHPAPLAHEPLGWSYYAAALLSVGVVAFMVYAYSRYRLLFFALAFYLINVVLVLGFIKVGSALTAERYTYISYTGLFVLIAWASQQLSEKKNLAAMAGWAFLTAISAYWAFSTYRQIPVWRDSETLWTQIVSQYPTEKCYSYRGYHRYLAQQWDKALQDFDKAYALNPRNETTVHIRAICLEKSGKTAEALKTYSEYTQNFPPKADVFFQHAALLNGLKRTAEAIVQYEKGLALNPQNIDGWTNLATAYFAEKQPEKAEEACTKALELDPKFLIARNNRGALRLSMGKYKEAVEDFDTSLAIKPDQPQSQAYRKICLEKLK